MSRTRYKRPLPLGKISPIEALIFSISLGVVGVLILGLFFNWKTGMLSLATILFYSIFYTLYLKRTTPYNIVIGGIAGAMAPVGAWMAATGGTAIVPWVQFLIIFLWTPPHFWALALCHQDDYRAAGYPMLPLVKGEKETIRQIGYYTAALVLGSLAPMIAGFGWFYFVVAAILGVVFIGLVWRARIMMAYEAYRNIFRFSILYIFILFAGMAIDRFL